VSAGTGRPAARVLGREAAAAAGAELTFVFEGRPLVAREGDSVAAALIANGVDVFGRSSKYHRPRGYRCGRGHCSSCAMRVDGLPGVRTCVTPVRAGMTVEREHAWPSAERDVLRTAELLSPLMPPGFYYRRFRRSPRLWGLFERGLARVAGQGDMPSPEAVERLGAARCARRAVDVLVVGGGAAGMSASLAAADAGAQVLLVTRGDRLGGGLADDVPPGPALAADLAARTARAGRLEVLTMSDAVAWYEEGTVAVDRSPDLLLVDPSTVVLATGGYDAGLPFPNWDLPGVMAATAARRLGSRHRVPPGSRAVVVTSDDGAYGVALQLLEWGVEVACVADFRESGGEEGVAATAGVPPHPVADRDVLVDLAGHGVDLLTGLGKLVGHGSTRVRSVTLTPRDLPGRARRRPRSYACDTICYSNGMRPADDLAYQALASGSLVLSAPGDVTTGAAVTGDAVTGAAVPGGASPGGASPTGAAREEGGPGPRRPGLRLAGLVAGATSAQDAVAQGEAAGREAAEHALRS